MVTAANGAERQINTTIGPLISLIIWGNILDGFFDWVRLYSFWRRICIKPARIRIKKNTEIEMIEIHKLFWLNISVMIYIQCDLKV